MAHVDDLHRRELAKGKVESPIDPTGPKSDERTYSKTMRDRATTASLHPAGAANDFLYGAGASIALRFLVADHEHTCADMLHGGGQGSPKVGPQGDQRSSTNARWVAGEEEWISQWRKPMKPLLLGAAIGDVSDLVAALGLVHVMGRDQHRHAACRKLVDLTPELTSRFGVDASCWLVE
jgi:hypothetical protein